MVFLSGKEMYIPTNLIKMTSFQRLCFVTEKSENLFVCKKIIEWKNLSLICSLMSHNRKVALGKSVTQ